VVAVSKLPSDSATQLVGMPISRGSGWRQWERNYGSMDSVRRCSESFSWWMKVGVGSRWSGVERK
jgi:hypothetical protein